MRLVGRLAVAVGALALVAGCSGSGNQGFTGGYVTSEDGITKVAEADRKVAPVISGTDLVGKPISSADYAGKTLVVNVWGSWCPPCRKEAPALQEVATQYADKGVQFLGINVRDDTAAAIRFNAAKGVTYPSLDDYGAKSVLGLNKILPSQAIPTTWIIDAKGRLAVRLTVDGLTASTLAGLIDDVQTSTA